jgi:hypothetical protein
MRAGDFRTAADLFVELARTAPHPLDRVVVLEQWRLADEWARRGLVLVARRDLGETGMSAKAADERTSDEIAMLYTSSVFYGLGTGAWVAVLADSNSAKGFVLPALGFAGASAGAVALLDSGRPLRYGVAQSIVTGMYIGLEEGLAWTLWNQARASRVDEWGEPAAASVIWGMSTAGAVAGGVIGSTAGTTPGRAAFVGSTAFWTGWVAGLAAASATETKTARDDHGYLAGAIGLSAGAIGGALAAGPVSPTVARVRFLDLGGISGALLVGGVYVAAKGERVEASPMMISLASGMGVGLGVAWFATAGMPEDRREARDGARRRPLLGVSPTLVPVPAGVALGVRGDL